MFSEAGMQVEFMFERCVDLQAEVVAITFDFIAQQRARASAPRPAIGLADVAVDKVQRRCCGVRAITDRHATGQIGNQPQITIGAHGLVEAMMS